MTASNPAVAARDNLRQQLASGWLLSAGCYDAWSARLAEHAGFTSLHFSGGAYHTSQFAYAGLVYTMPELIAQVGRITSAVQLPMLVDLDSGFGGLEDVMRTIREAERAGAAAVHIEDVQFPMVRDEQGRIPVIGHDAAVARIRAAVAARSDTGFLVVGRSDSTESVEDLIERCNLYLQAGADVAFPLLSGVKIDDRPLSALPAEERAHWYARIVREIEGPVLTVGGVDRMFSAPQLRDFGFTWVILPLVAFNAATAAMSLALKDALEDGLAEGYFAMHPNPISPAEYRRLVGYDQIAERTREFTSATTPPAISGSTAEKEDTS